MKQLVDLASDVRHNTLCSCLLQAVACYSLQLKGCLSYVMLFFCVQAACILLRVVCSKERRCAHGDAMALSLL
jgi:hypothetical protein